MKFVNLSVSVPGAVPVDSILGSSYEQQISLSWREPLQTYGLIRQYEVRFLFWFASTDTIIFTKRKQTTTKERIQVKTDSITHNPL